MNPVTLLVVAVACVAIYVMMEYPLSEVTINVTPYSDDNNNEQDNVPQKARDVADKIKENDGEAPEGYQGGAEFENKEGLLPKGVKYKEYDVDPLVKGENRGAERIVIGDDGSVWYTNDHYQTFILVE
ncbi:MAG: ribonuclease domain-containing protein [Eubacteriales bacterium]